MINKFDGCLDNKISVDDLSDQDQNQNECDIDIRNKSDTKDDLDQQNLIEEKE